MLRKNSGVAPVGESHVRWDGHETSGDLATAGVYFARLERASSGTVATVPLFRTR